MNNRFIGLLFAAILVALMTSLGCAKKNKPDMNEYSNALSGDSVQDKDMTFDPTGSDSGKIDGLSTVHFEYDKSLLTEEARSLLVKDADWLRRHSSKTLQIEGHCDRHGSTEYNLALGDKRARAVMHYLINLGVEKDRLSTISYGKEQMLDTAETDEADAKNRRANFKPIESPKLKRMTNL